MKILHTISGLGVNAGGPSSCIYNLLKGLQENITKADVLTIDSKNDNIIGNDRFIYAVADDTKTFFVYSKNFKTFLLQHNEVLTDHDSLATTILSDKLSNLYEQKVYAIN